MSEFTRDDASELIRAKGLGYSKEGFGVKSGRSHWYCDIKAAVAQASDLRSIAGLILRVAVNEMGVSFNTVGGPTMGADALVAATSMIGWMGQYYYWFSVRKEIDEQLAAQRIPPESPPRFPPSTPAEQLWIEGSRPGQGDSVLWLEDAISTGGSVLAAMDRFSKHPTARYAQVVGAIAVVDRDEIASGLFASMNIPYASLVTYRDLGIPALHEEQFD